MNSLQDLKEAGARKGSLSKTIVAVLWSFFGVRKAAGHDADIASLNPVHVIIAGLVIGIFFVLSLVLLVQLIVR
jgi:hypothetical protein